MTCKDAAAERWCNNGRNNRMTAAITASHMLNPTWAMVTTLLLEVGVSENCLKGQPKNFAREYPNEEGHE